MFLSEKDQEKLLGWHIPILLVLMNLILKLAGLTITPVSGDEPFTIYHAQMDLPSINRFLEGTNNPPLFEMVLHFWIRIFGNDVVSVRLLPVIFSSVAAFFVYRTGYTFVNFRVGITAALVYTFSVLNLHLAHEARVYALFTLLACLSMYIFLNLITGRKERKYLIYLSIVNLLLLYSHYISFFVILVQTLLIFTLPGIRHRLWRAYVLSLMALFLLFLPNLMSFIHSFRVLASQGTCFDPPDGLVSVYNLIWKFSNKPVTAVLSLIILLAALIKFLVGKDRKSTSAVVILILVWFGLPFILTFLVSYKISIFQDRYLVYCSVAFYLLLAFCVDYLFTARLYKYILSAVLVLLFALTFRIKEEVKSPVKEVVEKVQSLKDGETALVISPHFYILNFMYYYDPEFFSSVQDHEFYHKGSQDLSSMNIFPVNDLDGIEINEYQKVLFLDATSLSTFKGEAILSQLKKEYWLQGEDRFKQNLVLYEFGRREGTEVKK